MRVAPLLLVASASAVERWFDVCPESDAVIHAWARTTVRFDAPCKTVKNEVLARIAGKNGWSDPHNAGSYELTSSVGDVVAADHVTGDGKFTDKLRFMFENADGGDDCEVSGCSVSQVARGVHDDYAWLWSRVRAGHVGHRPEHELLQPLQPVLRRERGLPGRADGPYGHPPRQEDVARRGEEQVQVPQREEAGAVILC